MRRRMKPRTNSHVGVSQCLQQNRGRRRSDRQTVRRKAQTSACLRAPRATCCPSLFWWWSVETFRLPQRLNNGATNRCQSSHLSATTTSNHSICRKLSQPSTQRFLRVRLNGVSFKVGMKLLQSSYCWQNKKDALGPSAITASNDNPEAWIFFPSLSQPRVDHHNFATESRSYKFYP